MNEDKSRIEIKNQKSEDIEKPSEPVVKIDMSNQAIQINNENTI